MKHGDYMPQIKVLNIMGSIFRYGGTESFVMSYYRNIDRTQIQFDFVVHGFEKGVYDDEINSLGGKIYQVPVKSKDYSGNIRELKKITGSGEYQIIHTHNDAMGMIALKIAKKYGLPVRIANSLNTDHQTTNKIQYTLNEYARKRIKKYATHLTACSGLAGSWLFGEDAVNNNQVRIFKTAIDFDEFCYNEEKRNKLRTLYGIQDNLVIGHVGRFSEQKNHMFLLDIFKEIHNINPKAKLLLAGFGHLQEQIENKINALGLNDYVTMLGQISGTSEIMNAFDIFILPSLYEGQPVVLTEAQANGLQCYISGTVTKEVDIFKSTDSYKLVSFLSLNDSPEKWAETICNQYDEKISRKISKEIFSSTGYEIKEAAKGLQDFYTTSLS